MSSLDSSQEWVNFNFKGEHWFCPYKITRHQKM